MARRAGGEEQRQSVLITPDRENGGSGNSGTTGASGATPGKPEPFSPRKTA